MFGSKEYKNLETKVDKIYINTINHAKQITDLNLENAELYRENKELRYEKEQLLDVLKEINKKATSNTYGNAEAILGKLKELSTTATKQYR